MSNYIVEQVMAIVAATIQRVRSGFYGWRIVALMLGPRSAGNGVYVFGNTLFVISLEESLGLDRSMSSIMFAVGGVIGGLTAPISGMFMDRWGPRLVLIWSVLIGAVGYCLLGIAPNAVTLFLVFVGPISFVMLNVSFNASSGVINNWFDRYKSTAFSLMQGGAGLGSLAIIAVIALSIEIWGWRPAAFVAAGIIVLLGLPTALAMRDTPEEMGLLPDGNDPFSATGGSNLGGGAVGMSSKAALRTSTFWIMAASLTLFGGAIGALGIHFVPVMVWKGLTEVEGALMLTLWALSSVGTIVLVGWLADQLGRLRVGGAACLVIGVGVVLLNLGGSGVTLWIAVFLLSASSGLFPVMWSALGEVFGRSSYSTIRGYMMAAQSIGTLGTPIMVGMSFDSTGSYTLPLTILSVMWAGAAVFLFLTPGKSLVTR